MCATHRTDEQSHSLHDVAVAEEARVERPVGYCGMRCNLKGAAEIAPVRHGDHQHRTAFHARHTTHAHFDSAIREELTQGSVDVNRIAPEKVDPLGCLEHRGVESEAAAVEEVMAVRPSDIDPVFPAPRDKLGDLLRLVVSHAERFREVVAGANWHGGKSTL